MPDVFTQLNFDSTKHKDIAVDLRSLHTAEFSGVESFAVNVLEQLLAADTDNIYHLFYNGFTKKQFEYFHFVNAEYKQTRIPNRLLNLSLKLFGYPKLEKLIGQCNVLFMPNWNMLAVGPNTKVVLTVHDLSPQLLPQYYNLKARAWHWFINIPKLIKRADKLIAVSEFTKLSLVEKLHIAPDKITVAPLGVDHENFHANLKVDRLREVRNHYNLPGDFVLFVGTVEPRKNLARLVEAMEQLNEPIALVIAGRLGWKYSALLKQIEQSPKRRSIILLGYVPEADKPYLMKLARVFAYPSMYEGFGLPVLEAMAVGTPVLTSNVSSLPEVAGDAALLINPYNSTEIAEGIKRLHLDKPLREHYITKGLERSKQFTWEKCASIVKSVIH
ncbi:MAG TPA: glycosyltransferase family 1 protein [Patescibacteria group bacterium]|jgi:glycosyltransferase involved in cell wall biosynthesis|nr:glycosyltransferase family 1 protein [Patescibacteria group bacterium]